jgi:hypothetical protein
LLEPDPLLLLMTTIALFPFAAQSLFLKFDMLLKRADDRRKLSPLRFLRFIKR